MQIPKVIRVVLGKAELEFQSLHRSTKPLNAMPQHQSLLWGFLLSGVLFWVESPAHAGRVFLLNRMMGISRNDGKSTLVVTDGVRMRILIHSSNKNPLKDKGPGETKIYFLEKSASSVPKDFLYGGDHCPNKLTMSDDTVIDDLYETAMQLSC